jgi:hypothetical protein
MRGHEKYEMPAGIRRRLARCLICCSLITFGPVVRAQDTVTIPKSRLEELERKEAELQRLKGAAAQSNSVPAPAQTNAAATPPAKLIVPVLPPAKPAQPPPASPLQPGEVVEATDLASHYHANEAVADARYRKKKFTVRGEVAGFEKPLLTSNYKILLKTGDPQARVVCDLLAPDNATGGVFTMNHGTELVAQGPNGRVQLAKVGDVLLVNGSCRGWHKQDVTIQGREFHIEH